LGVQGSALVDEDDVPVGVDALRDGEVGPNEYGQPGISWALRLARP
jgi:hypothetical protein